MRWPWTPKAKKAEPETIDDLKRLIYSESDRLLTSLSSVTNTPESRSGWAYAVDSPFSFYVTTSPKRLPGATYSVDQLRQWARSWDPIRACIEYVKGEVSAIPIGFKVRDDYAGQGYEREKFIAAQWIGDNGPLGGSKTRRVFEAQLLEDLLTIGTYSVWYERARNGSVLSCHAIDSGTIKPRIDAFGWVADEYPYEQWITGVKVGMFTADDLRYDGLFPRTDSPYFYNTLEFIAGRVVTGRNMDAWNDSWLDNTSAFTGATYSLPDMETQKFQEFINYWRAMTTEPNRRQETRWLPQGSEKLGDHSRKDQDFAEFEIQLIRRVCAVYGVQPASIGYAGEQYKVSQEQSLQSSKRLSVGRILQVRKEFYDDLLMRLGFPMLEVFNDDNDIREETVKTELRAKQLEYMTVNEVRAQDGLSPVEGGDSLRGVAYLKHGQSQTGESAGEYDPSSERGDPSSR